MTDNLDKKETLTGRFKAWHDGEIIERDDDRQTLRDKVEDPNREHKLERWQYSTQ